MKIFIYTHKENINIDSLNQYIASEKSNFSELIVLILNVVRPFNYDITENLKDLFNQFIENNSLNDNICDSDNIEEERESSGDDKDKEHKKN